MYGAVVVLFVLSVGATLAGDPWDFTLSNNRFAASVYKAASLKAEENLLLSPFSLATVLTLTQWGAKGETAEEIRQCLYLPEDKEEVASTLKHYLTSFRRSQPYVFRAINKIYFKTDYLLNDGFRNASEEVFGCELENVEFSAATADKINQWVEEKTEKKITQLVDSESLSNKTRALLLNTLFFKGTWSSPFTDLYTFKASFEGLAEKSRVDMMHNFGATYNYFESDELEAKFLEIPFEGDNVSMTIVLPNAQNGLSKLEQEIDKVLDIRPMLPETVDLSLPKFRVESKVNFKEILKMLGVNKAFEEGGADFSGIAGEPGDLFVDDVVQKSFIDLDESGVEAATASSIVILFNRNGVTPKEFTVDHPFLFYIKVDDFIVFVGRVMAIPSSNEVK